MEVTSCLPPPLTVYNGRTQRLPQGGLNQDLIRDLGILIRRIAAPEAPVRVPNAQECRFCDISVTDPDRVDEKAALWMKSSQSRDMQPNDQTEQRTQAMSLNDWQPKKERQGGNSIHGRTCASIITLIMNSGAGGPVKRAHPARTRVDNAQQVRAIQPSQWRAISQQAEEARRCSTGTDATTQQSGSVEERQITRGNPMAISLQEIDSLKEELDKVRPLAPNTVAHVEQKLRLEANYHSNAIEGNALTQGETRNLILHGLTARGKPMRDHLDIDGHDEALKVIEDAVKRDEAITEVFIRNLHKILLKEPYLADAITPDGRRVRRKITIGEYKTQPNNVETRTGEIYHFTEPYLVKPAMSDLIDWYRIQEQNGEHPIVTAATFHYRFVRIHPFDDGNGRMARLLMNMILIKHGYTVALIPLENRGQYLGHLEAADQTEDLSEFINFIGQSCKYSLDLHLKAASGEPLEDHEDIDREIALFKQSLANAASTMPSGVKYLEEVVYPFYEYCESKSGLFKGAFGRVRTNVSLFITGPDGVVITLCEGQPNLPDISVVTKAAADLRSISFNATTYLTRFQGRNDEHSLMEVKGAIDHNQHHWTFSLTGNPIRQVEDAEAGFDGLRDAFNELIRAMMVRLREKQS